MKMVLTIQTAAFIAVTSYLCCTYASLTEELEALSDDKSSPDDSEDSEWLDTFLSPNTDGRVLSKRDQDERARVQTACSCQRSVHLVDLGQRTYPRYVTSGACSNFLCRGHNTHCQSVYYTTYVLRNKKAQKTSWTYTQNYGPDEELSEPAAVVDNSNLYTLPGNLSRKWKLDGIRVIAACLCVN